MGGRKLNRDINEINYRLYLLIYVFISIPLYTIVVANETLLLPISGTTSQTITLNNFSSTAPLKKRCEISFLAKDEANKKHEIIISIDFDFKQQNEKITDDEANKMVESYLNEFTRIFSGESYEFYAQEDSMLLLIGKCKAFVDQNKKDGLSFHFYLSGVRADTHINVPFDTLLREIDTRNYKELEGM